MGWTFRAGSRSVVFGESMSGLGLVEYPSLEYSMSPSVFANPIGDGSRFGKDVIPSQTISLIVEARPDERPLDEVWRELVSVWRADEVRKLPGGRAVLETDTGRVAYGRPRPLSPDFQHKLFGINRAELVFECADDLWYGAESQSRIFFNAPAPLVEFAWLGDRDASVSVKRVNGEVVARNDFTNPNLVGDGTWAEVRRNYITVPNLKLSSAGWTKSTTAQDTPNGLEITPTVDIAIANSILFRSATEVAAATGESWAGGFLVENPGTIPFTVYARQYWNGAAVFGNGPAVVIAPGESKRVDVAGTAPTGTTHVRLTLATAATLPAGAKMRIVTAHNEKSSIVQPYLDGDTKPAGIVQPEDFRVRWLGTPNASESVMEGERVRGLTSTRCAAIVSSKNGKRAVRIIPTGGGNTDSSFAAIAGGVPAAIRGAGTFLATFHADSPAGSSSASIRSQLRIANPAQTSPQSPLAGMFTHRLEFSSNDGAQAALYGDGATSSRDVWWTDIGLFAAGYEGDVFSGDTPSTGRGLRFPARAPFRFTSMGETRNAAVQVEGDVATWPVFEIHGPVTNPEIEVQGVGRLVFDVNLAYDQFLRVDTRPWARWVQRGVKGRPDELVPMPGALSPGGSRLSDMSMLPGSYTVLLRGFDPTGTADMRVSTWPAYTSF